MFSVHFTGQVAAELSKDKPNKGSADGHTQNFLKTVNNIEGNLVRQLNYLSQQVTTHPHTGSSYGSKKDYQVGSLSRWIWASTA